MARAIFLLLLASAAAQGQKAPAYDADGNLLWPNGQGRYPLQRKGWWKVTGQAGAGTGTLDKLSALFRATPEAAAMTGYWMMESRTVEAGGEYEARFFPFVIEEILRNGKYETAGPGETQSIGFTFNRLPGSMGRRVFVDGVYVKPRVTGTFRGFPVLEGQDLMVARAGRDPWAPVPYAKALRMAMPLLEKDKATAEQRLADLKRKDAEAQAPAYEAQMRAQLEKYYGQLKATAPEKWRTREASMLQELQYNRDRAAKAANPQRDADGAWYWDPVDAHADAARRAASLTPSDAAAPACFAEVKAQGRYALPGRIDRAGADPACEPLVTDNPAYFDARLPRGAAQLLLVRSLGRCGVVRDGQFVARQLPEPGNIAHGCARHPFFWEQLNWAAVGALLAP